MKVFTADELLERDDDDDTPLLTPDEQTQPVTLHLTQAITTSEGAELDELIIQPPTTKDMLRFQRMKIDETKRSLLWFSAMTGQAPETIEELHLRDFRRLSAIVWAFSD